MLLLEPLAVVLTSNKVHNPQHLLCCSQAMKPCWRNLKKIFADLAQYKCKLSKFKSASNLHGHSCIYQILCNCVCNFLFNFLNPLWSHSFILLLIEKTKTYSMRFLHLPTWKASLQFLLLPSHYQERQTPPFILKSLLYTWNPIPSCFFHNCVHLSPCPVASLVLLLVLFLLPVNLSDLQDSVFSFRYHPICFFWAISFLEE